MQVAEILKGKGSDVVTAGPDDTIGKVVGLLKEKGIGAVVVTGAGGKVAGILSERDIVRAMPEHGAKLPKLRVADLMTRDVITCAPDGKIDEIMKTMTDGRFRHLPVVEGGKLLGIISVGDAVKHRLDELEAEAGALKDYIATG